MHTPVVMSQRPFPPVDLTHFFLGFCLMTAGRQTPNPLHRLFLTQAFEPPAGLKPQGLLALTYLHLLVQQSPPSHCSPASLTPLPQLEVWVLELVPVRVDDLDPDEVPVWEGEFDWETEDDPVTELATPVDEAATAPVDEGTTTPVDDATAAVVFPAAAVVFPAAAVVFPAAAVVFPAAAVVFPAAAVVFTAPVVLAPWEMLILGTSDEFNEMFWDEVGTG